MITRILSLIGAVFIASPLNASHCVQQRVAKPQVYAQKQLQNHGYYSAAQLQQHYYQPYAYYVGQSLREDAVAERIARKVEARLAKKMLLLQSEPEHPGLQLLTQKCAGCHSPKTKATTEGDEPDDEPAPVYFDKGKLKSLSDEQKKNLMDEIHDGRMPKDGEPIEGDDYVLIYQYLFPTKEKK